MSLQDGFIWPCYAVLHKIALAHIPEKVGRQAEMEFLDIKFDSSILFHAIHSLFYWRILKKTILLCGFINPYKKSAKQENSSLKSIKPDSSFCPQTSTKNSVQEFHLRIAHLSLTPADGNKCHILFLQYFNSFMNSAREFNSTKQLVSTGASDCMVKLPTIYCHRD
jgi:hypothetical protein